MGKVEDWVTRFFYFLIFFIAPAVGKAAEGWLDQVWALRSRNRSSHNPLSSRQHDLAMWIIISIVLIHILNLNNDSLYYQHIHDICKLQAVFQVELLLSNIFPTFSTRLSCAMTGPWSCCAFSQFFLRQISIKLDPRLLSHTSKKRPSNHPLPLILLFILLLILFL